MVFCANCGTGLAAGARFCPTCGRPQAPGPIEQAARAVDQAGRSIEEAVRRTEPLAIASLVAGILGLSAVPGLASIAAVALGILAKSNINADPKLEGRGMATAGIVLGVIGVVAVALIVLFLFAFVSALND